MRLPWPSSSLFKTFRQGNEILVNSLSHRLQEVENYDKEYEENLDELGENVENDNDPDPPAKRQKPSDENNNIFSSMTKRCKVQEMCNTQIDELLATNVTDLFRNGMNDEQYTELTKDDNNARPENCEGLTVVTTNQLIWIVISPGAQADDKKMQFVEKSVIKASTILTKTVNKMAEAPKIFTKLMKPVYSNLRAVGFVNIGYIGDILLCSYSIEARETKVREYKLPTKLFRGTHGKLLLSYAKPHETVSRESVSRWINNVMDRAGIDTSVYKSPSVRSASTSKAESNSVPISNILKKAGWSNTKTIAKLYVRKIEKDSYSANVLNN